MGFFDDDDFDQQHQNNTGEGNQPNNNKNGFGGYNRDSRNNIFNSQTGNDYYQNNGKRDYTATEAVSKCKRMIGIMAAVMAVVIVVTVVLCAVISSLVLNDKVEDAVSSYKRSYYLPENYSNSALSCISANLDSILELTCTATVNSQTVSGAATGFIVTEPNDKTKSVYVITNCHVVTYEYQKSSGGWWGRTVTETANYDSITANFISTSSFYKEGGYQMELIATDENNDLALLKFKSAPTGIKALTFCDSDMITMGEEAIVIGNAEGYGLAVTTGIVSNPDRIFVDGSGNDTYSRNVLQTDAALNPGNSGGPIFNIYNEVIGVATFKIADTENEGLGFGVLSNVVTNFISEVASNKKITVEYKVSSRGVVE